MDTVIDYSAGVPSAASIKAAGHIGAVRYLSPGREPWMKGKPVHREELDDFDNHGLQMAVCWQYGAGNRNDSDVMRGWEGGVADAKAAQAQLDKIRASGHPVFFCVDFDATLADWNNTIVEYFKGAASVLGLQRVGVYGSSRVVHWAMEDNVVATVEPGRVLGWVTRSWGSVNADGSPKGADYAVLFQRVHNTPGPDGVQIDINDVLHPEFGWRGLDQYQQPAPAPRQSVDWSKINTTIKPNPSHRGDPHFLPDVLRAFGVPVEEMPGWDTWGMGDFDQIWGVGVHHTGSNNTGAEYIARNPRLSNGLSSQLHQSRKPPYTMTLCGVGIAWHMGKGSYPGLPTNNANPLLIGIEPQSNGTDPWPEGMLDVYYRTVAAILWYLGHDSSRCIAHWEYSLIAQGKWDPGAGNGVSGTVMDMEHFRARVQHYIDNPPFMEGINDMQLDLNQTHKSRYPGSGYEGTLTDFWINADAHAFAGRVNTEKLLNEVAELKENNKLLADAITELATALRNKK